MAKLVSISGLTLYVKDLDITSDFYEKLGFRAGKRDEHSLTYYLNWFWIEFVLIAPAKGTIFEKEAFASPKGSGAYIAVSVDDVDEYYQKLISEGIKPSSEPRDWDWGRREFVLRDPDGYKLVFFKKIK